MLIHRLFIIDFDWIEVNFITREPGFYKKLFQSLGDTQDTNIFKIFQVPTVNATFVESFKFHNYAPILKYCQKSFNICFFCTLASAFFSIKKIKAGNAISLCIEEYLGSEVINCIDFSNAILKNEKK